MIGVILPTGTSHKTDASTMLKLGNIATLPCLKSSVLKVESLPKWYPVPGGVIVIVKGTKK